MATRAKTAFEEATAAFLDYLSAYRGYSQHSVKACARDKRRCREFLAHQYSAAGSPGQVRREMVVAFALSLKGDAPLTIRRKLAAVASFYAFL
jgi:site-specific recombinase XerD